MAAVKDIDVLLPQTQCGECGYGGCMPYAEALAQGVATIDRCPPGGVDTLNALAQLLKVNPAPYRANMEKTARAPMLAVIREEECIGCTKCIQACPVDAIIGSGKLMHSIINHECTGCGLCVEPCPVDCIEMHIQQAPNYDRNLARTRFQARKTRDLRTEHEKQQVYRQKIAQQQQGAGQELKVKQAYVLQALARVNAKKIP